MLTSAEIRQKFLDFFSDKGHQIVASAPIVIKNDPTLMFTNAGMNQFKDIILGNAPARDKRVADTQKCLRVSGKHNDLEEVGHDTYHHTMFEMLGNWSFGDYFKKETIAWAWELLTEVYGLPKDRLYVTIFEGDQSDDLPRDTEAYDSWKEWISEDRILNGNKKDNFWEMGDVGPCGPSSEIHIDLRSDEERNSVPGDSLVNQDHPLVVEIWNLVFMEFNRKADGTLVHLPARHVDTGMGFERLCMALQDKKSNYDTDVFQPIIREIEKISGLAYGKNEEQDVAFRVIADHLRAVSFAVADGQLPSNNGAGYVIRRILRRAIRYGYQFLNLKEPFIYRLVEVLQREMGEFFPEIRTQKELVVKVIQEEEAGFLRTVEQGLNRLNQILESTKDGQVSGKQAFELFDTFGFPLDLTQLILRERGYTLDEKGFQKEMAAQKERSRQATSLETGDWVTLLDDDQEEFVGYDRLESSIRIAAYRQVQQKKKSFYQLVFTMTPFYPEGGGQVGDKGFIEAEDERIRIFDTKRENGQIVHYAEKLPENLHFPFTAVVDRGERISTARNHSATHLLHETLREVLGTHVEQKGSLVAPDHLRFDFSHFQKLTQEEIREIEGRVNERIRQNLTLEEFRNIPQKEALDMGAMALFGEKYGDTVRAIKFGSSIELCGGTHVQATGDIGLFLIVHESAVAAGIRRIEAITGKAAESYIHEKMDQLREIAEEVKNPKNPIGQVRQLKDDNSRLQKEVARLTQEKASHLGDQLIAGAESINGIRFIGKTVDLDMGAIKDLCFRLKSELKGLVVVIGNSHQGKANISVAISDDVIQARGLKAGDLVKKVAPLIKGGGGGQPGFAAAGGSDPNGLEAAYQESRKLISQSNAS